MTETGNFSSLRFFLLHQKQLSNLKFFWGVISITRLHWLKTNLVSCSKQAKFSIFIKNPSLPIFLKHFLFTRGIIREWSENLLPTQILHWTPSIFFYWTVFLMHHYCRFNPTDWLASSGIMEVPSSPLINWDRHFIRGLEYAAPFISNQGVLHMESRWYCQAAVHDAS